MSAIDFVMTYVKRSGAVDPKQKIVEYASICQLDSKLLTHLNIPVIQDIPIQNLISLYPLIHLHTWFYTLIVCMYEEVEDLVSSTVVGCIFTNITSQISFF